MEELGMIRVISVLLITMSWSVIVLADEPAEVTEPPEIVLDAPSPEKEAQPQAVETETITIYESKIFPGFRPCTPEDYRNKQYDPIACRDDEASRTISTRDQNQQSKELIVEDDAVPQGNIYKLSFERFKKKKQ